MYRFGLNVKWVGEGESVREGKREYVSDIEPQIEWCRGVLSTNVDYLIVDLDFVEFLKCFGGDKKLSSAGEDIAGLK